MVHPLNVGKSLTPHPGANSKTNIEHAPTTHLGPDPLDMVDHVHRVQGVLVRSQVDEGVSRVDVDRTAGVSRHGQVGSINPLATLVEVAKGVGTGVILVACGRGWEIVSSVTYSRNLQ